MLVVAVLAIREEAFTAIRDNFDALAPEVRRAFRDILHDVRSGGFARFKSATAGGKVWRVVMGPLDSDDLALIQAAYPSAINELLVYTPEGLQYGQTRDPSTGEITGTAVYPFRRGQFMAAMRLVNPDQTEISGPHSVPVLTHGFVGWRTPILE